MTARSKINGEPIYFDKGWRWESNQELIDPNDNTKDCHANDCRDADCACCWSPDDEIGVSSLLAKIKNVYTRIFRKD